MRAACSLLVVLAATAALGAVQGDKPPSRPPQKGDTMTVKGCLAGGALEATEAEGLDATGLLIGGLTFRLTGDKKVLKGMRETHDGKVVSVTGVLKSDLPQLEGQSHRVGGMRITIGGATPNPNSPDAQSRRPIPVLQVKSFDGSVTACR